MNIKCINNIQYTNIHWIGEMLSIDWREFGSELCYFFLLDHSTWSQNRQNCFYQVNQRKEWKHCFLHFPWTYFQSLRKQIVFQFEKMLLRNAWTSVFLFILLKPYHYCYFLLSGWRKIREFHLELCPGIADNW